MQGKGNGGLYKVEGRLSIAQCKQSHLAHTAQTTQDKAMVA